MPLIAATHACLAFGHVPLLDRCRFPARPWRTCRADRPQRQRQVLAAGCARRDRPPRRRRGLAPARPPPCLRAAGTAVRSRKLRCSTPWSPAWAGRRNSSREWHAVSHRLAEAAADHDALLEELNRLQHELEALGAWSAASQAERAIERFGLDAEARVGTLSGGQKKRLALAQALAIGARSAAARRADQPPRSRRHRMAGRPAARLRHHAAVRHPRPPLSRPRGHTHRRTRSRPAGELSRQLRRLPEAQGRDAARRGDPGRQVRQVPRPGGSVDPQGRRGAAHAQRGPRAAARALARASARHGASAWARRAWRSMPATRAASWWPN